MSVMFDCMLEISLKKNLKVAAKDLQEDLVAMGPKYTVRCTLNAKVIYISHSLVILFKNKTGTFWVYASALSVRKEE